MRRACILHQSTLCSGPVQNRSTLAGVSTGRIVSAGGGGAGAATGRTRAPLTARGDVRSGAPLTATGGDARSGAPLTAMGGVAITGAALTATGAATSAAGLGAGACNSGKLHLSLCLQHREDGA